MCHQTESIYRRYAIVAEQDLREGVAKLAALEERDTARTVVVELRTGTDGVQSAG